MSGCKASSLTLLGPFARTWQLCNKPPFARTRKGGGCATSQRASAEKYDQAVVKYNPLIPILCPKSSWSPLERKPRWLLDAASASCGERSPEQGSVGALRSKKTFHRLLGFSFFFLLSQLHTLGRHLVCSQRCRHRGKKTQNKTKPTPVCTCVPVIIEKETPK